MLEARQKAGLSQRDLATKLGQLGLKIDPSAITRMEKGTRPVRLEEAVLIGRVLETSVGSLLGEPPEDLGQRLEDLGAAAAESLRQGLVEISTWLMRVAEFEYLIDQDPQLRAEMGDMAGLQNLAEALRRGRPELVLVRDGTDIEALKRVAAVLPDMLAYHVFEVLPPLAMPPVATEAVANQESNGEHPEA